MIKNYVVAVVFAVAIYAPLSVAAKDGAPAADSSVAADHGTSGQEVAASTASITGAPAVVRLFCGPCYDRYAHQMMVRTVAWGVDATGEPEPSGTVWDRSQSGTLRIQSPPPLTENETLVLLLNGETFMPANVYAYFDGEWRNVAVHFGLPSSSVLPTLPPYIRVERAPFRETPGIDDRLFSLY